MTGAVADTNSSAERQAADLAAASGITLGNLPLTRKWQGAVGLIEGVIASTQATEAYHHRRCRDKPGETATPMSCCVPAANFHLATAYSR